MSSYFVRKRYHKKCIQGDVNIPYGTILDCPNFIILYNKLPVCYSTSQDSHDYFANNDDGQGKLRGKLIDNLLSITIPAKIKDKEKCRRIWHMIWEDEQFLKYKMVEHNDVWLWNNDFYTASIDELKALIAKVKAVK